LRQRQIIPSRLVPRSRRA